MIRNGPSLALQGALFPPAALWTPPRAADLPRDWNAFGRIGLDTETRDPLLKKLGPGFRRGAHVVGVSFAPDEGPGSRGLYLPLRHRGGDNVEDPALALGYLRYQAKRFRGEIVGAKLSYDLDGLAQEGVVFPQATFLDVQVAEPLLDELQYTYGLDDILARHGLPLKDEATLREAATQFGVDPKAELWKLPARFVGGYAETDAVLPLTLMRRQEAMLEEQGLGRVWRLECAVLPILVEMRRRGLRVDLEHLDRVERFSRAEEAKAWGELQRLTGVAVKLGDGMKAEVIARALAAVDVLPGRTSTGKPSITKEWLEALDHPVGAVIRRARKMSQLRTTFVNSVREHLVGDRVHCTFNQIKQEKDDEEGGTEGVAGGRLSSSNFNIQQQPARDKEIGPMWRSIYLADEGGEWASEDYSQQEPRLAVHFAVASGPARIGEAAHRSAVEARDRYIDDPLTDSHTMFTKMVYGEDCVSRPDFKTLRDECKQIFLGVCYGMGGPKLCRKIGKPTKVIAHWKTGRRMEVAGDEGQAILDLVNLRVPYVRATADAVMKVAAARGYVSTILGRRCRFPKDHAGNYDYAHKGFNRVIQNSAADQTKTALVELERAGLRMQIQVHDEFGFTIRSRAEAAQAAEIMRECLPLNVPSRVDVEIGPSWGQAKAA